MLFLKLRASYEFFSFGLYLDASCFIHSFQCDANIRFAFFPVGADYEQCASFPHPMGSVGISVFIFNICIAQSKE